MELKTPRSALADLPMVVSKTNGVILLRRSRATIQSFTGETGGGKVELPGSRATAAAPRFSGCRPRATQVRVRYPEGVSTVADADLNLTGTRDRSMLRGHGHHSAHRLQSAIGLQLR